MNRPPPYRLPNRGPAGAPALPQPAVSDPSHEGLRGLKRIYQDVQWSPSFILLLLYFFITMTYRFEGASIAVGGAVAMLVMEKGRRRIPYWMVWFLALLIWGMVSYTQSSLPELAWQTGVLEYAKIWLACLVAVNVLTSTARIRFFIIFFIILYVTHPVRGALFNQFVYGFAIEDRVVWRGAWANPNDMAALTFLPLGLAVGLLRDPNSWVRKGAMATVALLPIVILLTQSRGAFLAIGLFAMMTVFANLKQVRSLVAIGVLAMGAVFVAPEGTFDRFVNFTGAVRGGDMLAAGDDNSAQQRLDIWRVSLRIINNHPVFGVGLSAYPRTHREFTRGGVAEWLARGGRDAHSTYITVAAEVGYVGLFLFIVPFLIAIGRSIKTRRKLRKMFPHEATALQYLEAGLIAYMACGIFGSYSHTIQLWLALGFLALLTEDLRLRARRVARPGPGSRSMPRRPRVAPKRVAPAST